MAATLGSGLILDVHGGRACIDHRADGAGDVEGAAQPVSTSTSSGSDDAAVMRRTSVSTSSMVLMPRSGRPSELAVRPAGEIEGAEACGLGQARGVGVDGAGHLEGPFFRHGEAKQGSGGVAVDLLGHSSSLGGIITGAPPAFSFTVCRFPNWGCQCDNLRVGPTPKNEGLCLKEKSP